jgi:hypothetical protein
MLSVGGLGASLPLLVSCLMCACLLPPLCAERCVVAYCQGHSSWVSGVAFDPWCALHWGECGVTGGLLAAAASGI